MPFDSQKRDHCRAKEETEEEASNNTGVQIFVDRPHDYPERQGCECEGAFGWAGSAAEPSVLLIERYLELLLYAVP